MSPNRRNHCCFASESRNRGLVIMNKQKLQRLSLKVLITSSSRRFNWKKGKVTWSTFKKSPRKLTTNKAEERLCSPSAGGLMWRRSTDPTTSFITFMLCLHSKAVLPLSKCFCSLLTTFAFKEFPQSWRRFLLWEGHLSSLCAEGQSRGPFLQSDWWLQRDGVWIVRAAAICIWEST